MSPVTHKQIKITYTLLKANMTRLIVGGVQILDMVGNMATIAQWWQDVSKDEQERCQAMSHCGNKLHLNFMEQSFANARVVSIRFSKPYMEVYVSFILFDIGN